MNQIDTKSRTWEQVRAWACARLKKHSAKLLRARGDEAQRVQDRIDELCELLSLEGVKPKVTAVFTSEEQPE